MLTDDIWRVLLSAIWSFKIDLFFWYKKNIYNGHIWLEKGGMKCFVHSVCTTHTIQTYQIHTKGEAIRCQEHTVHNSRDYLLLQSILIMKLVKLFGSNDLPSLEMILSNRDSPLFFFKKKNFFGNNATTVIIINRKMNENQSPVSLPIMKVRYDVVVYINCCFEFVIMSCIH